LSAAKIAVIFAVTCEAAAQEFAGGKRDIARQNNRRDLSLKESLFAGKGASMAKDRRKAWIVAGRGRSNASQIRFKAMK